MKIAIVGVLLFVACGYTEAQGIKPVLLFSLLAILAGLVLAI